MLLAVSDWPTPIFIRVWPKSDRVLQLTATLPSFHPFLAILCSIFGYFTFLSGGLLVTRTDQHGPQKQLTGKIRPCDVKIDKNMYQVSFFFVNNFGANHFSPCLSGGCSEDLDAFRL